MNRARRVWLFGVVVLLACKGDSVTSITDLFGTYTLVTIDGMALPYSLTPSEEILTDKIVIEADKTWTESGTLALVDAGVATPQPFDDAGTVTVQGSAVSFLSTANAQVSYTGGFDKSTLTVTSLGFTFVFRKQ